MTCDSYFKIISTIQISIDKFQTFNLSYQILDCLQIQATQFTMQLRFGKISRLWWICSSTKQVQSLTCFGSERCLNPLIFCSILTDSHTKKTPFKTKLSWQCCLVVVTFPIQATRGSNTGHSVQQIHQRIQVIDTTT